MKRMFFRRACAALLCILVLSAAVLSRPAALNVNAASLVLGEAAANEMSMVLWNLLMNCLVACGVEASFGDYGMEVAFFTAYLNEFSVSNDVDSNITFTLADGSKVSLRQLISDNTVGTGALQIPDEATWQRFRVIDGGGSGSPDNDPQFTHLASFALDAGILLGISKFVEALQAGEIEGLDAADYFPNGFDGTLPRDAEGNYIGTLHMVLVNHQPNYLVISGGTWPTYTYYDNYIHRVYDADFSFSAPFVLYLQEKTSFSGSSSRSFSYYDIGVLCNLTGKVLGTFSYSDRYSFNGSVNTGSGSLASGSSLVAFNHHDFWAGAEADDIAKLSWTLDYKSTNLPIFSSREAAQLYLNTGDFSGCENALQYDPSALPDALPDNFAPLIGTELDPSVFNSLFPALLSAIQGAFPQPQPNPNPDAEPEPVPLPDPVAGTAAFNKVVADTAADVAAEASPNPDPKPEPDVDTDIGSYKVNLTNVFPFCLPFDLIRLFEALDAEPVTPCFDFPFVVPALDIDMSVQLDLSFLDGVMEIFRLCETVSFIIMLIFVTPQLIRW